MSGGIIAHADGITFGQPLGDTMVLVKAPGADNVKIENQTGIHTDWRGYAILPFATEYRENRVALNANSLQIMLNWMKPWSLSSQLTVLLPEQHLMHKSAGKY